MTEPLLEMLPVERVPSIAIVEILVVEPEGVPLGAEPEAAVAGEPAVTGPVLQVNRWNTVQPGPGVLAGSKIQGYKW